MKSLIGQTFDDPRNQKVRGLVSPIVADPAVERTLHLHRGSMGIHRDYRDVESAGFVVKANRMKMELFVNGRSVAKADQSTVLIEASQRFQARHEATLIARRLQRTDRLPIERQSVARAMLLVEVKFVKAFWVLERAVSSDGARGHASRNGIDYMHDRLDQYAQAVANGGWHVPAPRPALPNSKEIDEAVKVQRWLEYLDPTDARLLTIGAMSKRGDAGRKINWMRVRIGLPELQHQPIRTLQAYYTRALRHAVAELAMRGIN